MKIKRNIKIGLLIVLILFAICSFVFYMYLQKNVEEISYQLFLTHMEKGLIQEVVLSDTEKIEIKLENGKRLITDNPRTENFKENLLINGVKVIEKDSYSNGVFPIIFIIIFAGFGVYYFKNIMPKQAEKEMSSMSNVETFGSSNNGITFSSVAGNEEAKESLKDLVHFIQNPEVYNKYGARLPRGVLLYGEPGTGKTLLAKALAGEAGVPFYAVSGSDFVQVYAGLGASRIRELFKKAKQSGKSVIFIDEIDSLGKKRKSGASPSGSEEGDRTLNALLTEMSGFNENEGILVVAATNRVDILDEALLRPGRFDRQIEICLPDLRGREQILKLHSRNKPMSLDIDFKKVAMETVYFSGSKLENLLNESAILAVKESSEKITMNHINKSYYKVLVGDEKTDRSGINELDKKITAYHEAGHALVAKLISGDIRVTKVSIIPSTKGMGGFSVNIPKDKMYQTKKDLIISIMTSLGGRAAEEIVFGKEYITTGASSDLEKATEMTLSMIGIFGMDESVGLLNYNLVSNRNIDIGNIILNRGKEILDDLYMDTIKIINSNKFKLDILANRLIEKEVIDEGEINTIMYSKD